MIPKSFALQALWSISLAYCALAFHLPSQTTARTKTALDVATDFGLFDSPSVSESQLKAQILQLGAALDRGQAYNPTSGDYYSETMAVAKDKIEQLVATEDKIPTTLEDLQGEWELVLSTVPHGIFRSSPFFLAIQESYEYAEEKGTSMNTRIL